MTEQSELEIQNKVRRAIERLLSDDEYLLKHDVNERSISHRLAPYLQDEFGKEWHVDCEYNRDNNITKKLRLPSNNVKRDDTTAKTVFPDIIVHRRGTNHNLLVIEMKKTNNAGEQEKNLDFKKLQSYKEQYHYCHTFYLQLRTQREIGIDEMPWDGKCITRDDNPLGSLLTKPT